MPVFKSLFKGGKTLTLLVIGLLLGIWGWGAVMGVLSAVVGSLPMEAHLLAPLAGLALAGYLIEEVG